MNEPNPIDDACCAGDRSTVLAGKLAALSHPARLGILLQLGGSGPCCCKQVVERFDLAQSTVSQHLKVLLDAGLVRLQPQAQRSVYEVDADALAEVSDALAGLARQCCAPTDIMEDQPLG